MSRWAADGNGELHASDSLYVQVKKQGFRTLGLFVFILQTDGASGEIDREAGSSGGVYLRAKLLEGMVKVLTKADYLHCIANWRRNARLISITNSRGN